MSAIDDYYKNFDPMMETVLKLIETSRKPDESVEISVAILERVIAVVRADERIRVLDKQRDDRMDAAIDPWEVIGSQIDQAVNGADDDN